MEQRTIKLAGSFDLDVEVPAVIVGSLAVHRPAYQYMRGTPVTILKTGWAVSHVATGLAMSAAAGKGPRGESKLTSRKAAIAWAEKVQQADPQAWSEADDLAFGGGGPDRDLALRLLRASQSVEAAQ